jgi:hypothetical protein
MFSAREARLAARLLWDSATSDLDVEKLDDSRSEGATATEHIDD